MAENHPFEQALAKAWNPALWHDVTVLVAVSGGADSVGLLRALSNVGAQMDGQLVVAHFNHQLRGEESAGDERFTRNLSKQLGIPCEVGRADGPLSSTGDGLEAEARQRRYRFLRETADRRGARYVVTAHTADDQSETILHRVLRGTGLSGLAGIPTTRRLSEMTTIIRPMLFLSRSSVRDYLLELNQPFREDSTNELPVFTRNRIRHHLLPVLAEQYNPQVKSSLLRLGALAGEAQKVIDSVVEPLLDQTVINRTADRVDLSLVAVRDQPAFLVRELLVRIWKQQCWPRRDMSEAKWSQLGELLHADPPAAAITLPGNIHAEFHDDVVVLWK